MPEKLKYIKFANEECRLRYLIDKYKAHDRKRSKYIEELHAENERLKKIAQRQSEEMDELISAYENAKPLILNPKQKAYIYELIRRSAECSNYKAKCESLTEQVQELEKIIKTKQNGK